MWDNRNVLVTGGASFIGSHLVDSLKVYHRQYGMKTSSVRIFTAYGPRENETHAIIAQIAKAFIRMNPYVIWGTGKQDRNFTCVQDIVDFLISAAEKIEDGSPINVGRNDRITIDRVAEIIFDIVGWRPQKIIHNFSKPQGVASRAADLNKAKKFLGLEPKISYREGLEKTIKSYLANNKKKEVKTNLNSIS